MGKIPANNVALTTTSSLSLLLTEDSLSKLWSLDVLGITDPSAKKMQTELQKAAREHFLKTISLDEENRFEVSMPWLEDHPPLPTNYDLAYRRLKSTVNRLKTQSIYKEYEHVFDEWLEEGIIEEVIDDCEENVHYLPHRAVIKENSTTKIRPVFDASAKIKGFPSLNDCLEKGENLIELIPSILMRFRTEKIGVISDIRKAFLQIGLIETDRNYLRFLWLSDAGLKTYRHCRVVFGVSCSPFLLSSTINYLLTSILKEIQEQKSTYPECVVQKLMKSFYVDNCVASVKDTEELNLFIRVSTEIMAERKFDLRGWEHTDFTAENSQPTNVLGMIWDKKFDTLQVNTKCINELDFKKVTKRTILSAAHRLFDPLGIICPVTLIPKLLLQSIWKMKLNWDEDVDENIRREFLNWLENVPYIEKTSIPRYFGLSGYKKCSIHFFCDASKVAYAVVAYIRLESENCVQVQLLQARSRVAPTGKEEITIARLELLAATIASRLSTSILPEIRHDEVFFWTDSTTVLAWIKRSEPWAIFVYNRVSEIREKTDVNTWRHVPGTMNPADLPSRGGTAKQLLRLRWWEGPSWLHLPRETWPRSEFSVNEEEVLKEKKKEIVSSMLNLQNIDNSFILKFSSYSKTVKIIAWLFRFINNCRIPRDIRKYGNLDFEEISAAEYGLIRIIQKESFVNEQDEKLKTLGAFKDKNDIIRLKTKILHRQDSEDFRMPVILPSRHEVVKRIVMHYHVKNAHAGTQMLLNILRERFWILHGRRTVRSILDKCIVCKRHSTKKLDALTASLPEDRIREAAVFEICGVDLAGPLFLRDNNKSWICLFTCAVYRAVHVELVTSLSTHSFLMALRRFIARRGRCSIIYCDNGSNFVGASNLLRALDWNLIVSDTALHPIRWKFNPPTASWWGGWWERLIGILKRLLRRVLGRSSLTYEQMTTVLCDCESIINSRPLTYVADNDAELVPLTPSMFLQDIQMSGVPDCDKIDHQSLNQRVKYRQNLQKALRNRFRSEYLGALLQRPESKRVAEVVVGDVVLIGSDDKKRINWPLGKIMEVIPGKDGVTRLVRLKTARGELLRPIQRLYPLEVSAAESMKIREKLPSAKLIEQPTISQSVDCNTEPSEETRKTRSGRVVKMPYKLDL